MMTRPTCPICNNQLVMYRGPVGAPVLLLGEFPGVEEVKYGIPFTGKAGEILKQEIFRLRVPWDKIRLGNLWWHFPHDNEEDFQWNWGQTIREMRHRQYVLLMGSEWRRILEHKIMDVAGLKVTSAQLPKAPKFYMAAPNPALCIHTTVGDFRDALEKFISKIPKKVWEDD